MAVYQRFPIADFRNGYVKGRAPWLQPSDAFPTLTNGRITNGVLEKRLGYALLKATGASLPIMGIYECTYNGQPNYLVIDTKRAYLYDLYNNTMTDKSEANTYTGGDDDFFKFCTYYNKSYFVNSANGIYNFDGSTGTVASVSTAGAVTIATCNSMFMLKSRLHFVSPTIGATYYPNRIYYSDVGTATITAATQYYTYERDDVPLTHHPWDMDNELVFGHKGVWRVEATGDSSTPFRCRMVNPNMACLAPVVTEHNSPSAGRLLSILSRNHLMSFDGYRFSAADGPIRDIVSEMAASNLHYCQAVSCTSKEALYFSYPRSGQTYPDRILEYSIDENTWSEHTITMHCMAAISGEVDPTEYALDDNRVGRMYTGLTVAGDITGNLYQLDSGGDDNGSDIEFKAISAALNPFHRNGRKAYLGYIEVYADTDATASFTLNVYKDDGDTAYKSVPVSCDGGGDRFWQRVNIGGESGNFHRIEITNDDSDNRPRIHAIVPWFKPGGLIAPSSDSSADWPNQTWRLHTESGVTYIQRRESGSWVNYQTWGE